MSCKVHTTNLSVCGLVQGGVILATTAAGAIAAPFALTAVTVGAVALTAGLFAAPAVLFGIVTTGIFTLSAYFPDWVDKHPITYFVSSAVVFALLSAAAITAGVMLGVLTTSLMIVFIVAALMGTAIQAAPLVIPSD